MRPARGDARGASGGSSVDPNQRQQGSDPGRAAESDRGARTFSLAGKLAAVTGGALVLYGVLVLAGTSFTAWPAWLVHLLALGLTLPLAFWAAHRLERPLVWTLRALSDGIRSFQDGDFGERIAAVRGDELGELVRLYNSVGEALQDERTHIRQRELLLQTALDSSPVALALVNPLDRVIFANREARRLFLGGAQLEGRHFGEILDGCPEELRRVLSEGGDGIFSVDSDGGPETYHLTRRTFQLNRRRHELYLLRRMTLELSRQEAEIWKKVIRVISHELNNSLAPISSLAHSGSLIAAKPDQARRLESIHDSIRERVDHLTRFLEGYARFARLPKPHKQRVDWREWLDAPLRLYPFRIEGEPPATPGFFDAAQLQQVLINLLKNAAEASAGQPEITVRIDRLADGGARVRVADRGRGMSEEVMQRALLPFYSTKASGSGVGLPLSREIIEAHGGSLRIRNRAGGGTEVSFHLPPEPDPVPLEADCGPPGDRLD